MAPAPADQPKKLDAKEVMKQRREKAICIVSSSFSFYSHTELMKERREKAICIVSS
jgi:hypothetical protein